MSGSTVVLAPAIPTDFTSTMMSTCTRCGHDVSTPDEAHRRIKDLEAQVRLLNTKAAAAVDKLADYEDEVRSLRSAYAELQKKQQEQQQQSQVSPSKQSLPSQSQPAVPSPPPIDQPSTPTAMSSTITTPPVLPVQSPSSPPRITASRLASLSSFLPGRKRDTAILQQPPNTPLAALFAQNTTLPENPSNPGADPSNTASATNVSLAPSAYANPTLLSLQSSLEAERTLRLKAETSLNQTQSELEELTATLFGQANEMVATERKARAKLEERVKVLEDRDGEKRRRLERLEKALERIDRVRGLVRQEREKGAVKIEVVEFRNGVSGNDEDGSLRVVN